MRNTIVLVILIIAGPASVFAQTGAPTLASIEAQVVQLQNCCNKYASPVMLQLPATVASWQALLNGVANSEGILRTKQTADEAALNALTVRVTALEAKNPH